MSTEHVIQWRANALYNKALLLLPQNPQWVKQLFQNNPELIGILIECVAGNTSWEVLKDRIQGFIREEAIVKATDEVATGSMTIEKIQDTLEN